MNQHHHELIIYEVDRFVPGKQKMNNIGVSEAKFTRKIFPNENKEMKGKIN